MSLIFNNAQVYISTSTAGSSVGQDVSQSVMSVKFNRKYAIQDNTHFGQSAKSQIAGIEEWSFETEMIQSFSTAQAAQEAQVNLDRLFRTLWDLSSTGKPFYVALRPVNTARSSENPEYGGLCIMQEYSPMDGKVGDLLKTKVPFISVGNLSVLTVSSG